MFRRLQPFTALELRKVCMAALLLSSFYEKKVTGASEGTWHEQRLLGMVWDGPSDPGPLGRCSWNVPSLGSLSQFLGSFPARLTQPLCRAFPVHLFIL